MSPPFRSAVRRWRRTLCEAFGCARHSRPSLHELDRKLERHLDFDGGLFVEAGANDGYQQSNTYYFEKVRGWTGLLVEPLPRLVAECRRNRRARVVQAALVDFETPGRTVEVHAAGLMSTIEGALGGAEATARHVAQGLEVQRLAPEQRIRAPARTLSSLLSEAGITRGVDLLSLDVEGAEVMALTGLDFALHAPRFVCVEARDRAGIFRILQGRYRLVEVLTESGSHQDLLFALR